MADRPIIFSAPMVRALLAGTKTQTRRVLKPQPPERPAANCHPSHQLRHEAPYLDAYCGEPRTERNPRGMSRHWHWWQVDDRLGPVACRAPCAPGDRLWAREAWRPDPNFVPRDREVAVFYPADSGMLTLLPGTDWRMPKQAQRGKVTPLHMPRWASRLTLHVTEVRVQRLQEISEQDARAEGAKAVGAELAPPDAEDIRSYVWGFHGLWNSLHGADAWDANPWVCAISFTVERANIDQARNA